MLQDDLHTNDQEGGSSLDSPSVQGDHLLQTEEKSRTKGRMTTLPTLAVALVSMAAVPLVSSVSSHEKDLTSSQYEAQNTISNQGAQTQNVGSDVAANSGDHRVRRTVLLPVPTIESALAYFEDRQLVAHFAERLSKSSSSSSKKSDRTHAAAPASSSSARSRVRIKDLSFPEPPEPPADDHTAQKVFGVYLTATSASKAETVDSALQNLLDSGGSAMVLDIKGSFVYFPTTAKLANEFGLARPLYDLKEIVEKAHEKGIYVIGRYISVKDALLAQVNGGEFSMRHPKTNVNLGTDWVEPSNETVHEYNREIIYEAALSGIDEINLDYIRYPTSLPQTLAAIPTEVKSERIESFVKIAREAIDEAGMGTKLGISSYAILGWNFDANLPYLGQDVIRLAPYLDVISPMAYPSTFAETGYGSDPGGRSRDYWLVYRTLTGYAELIGPDHAWKLRPWIQAYYKNSKNIRDEIDAVINSGGCGFTMWSASNEYSQAYAAFRGWKQPEHCQRQATL